LPILFTGGSLLYDFWVFSNGIKSFDVLIAVLVHLQAQSSQLFDFARHQVYFLQQSQRAENTLFKQCNMAAMLLL